jgi:hypothetical protein
MRPAEGDSITRAGGAIRAAASPAILMAGGNGAMEGCACLADRLCPHGFAPRLW